MLYASYTIKKTPFMIYKWLYTSNISILIVVRVNYHRYFVKTFDLLYIYLFSYEELSFFFFLWKRAYIWRKWMEAWFWKNFRNGDGSSRIQR